jgi:hypothetical protein
MLMGGPRIWDMKDFGMWMHEDGPLRWLLILGKLDTDKALYLPHQIHLGALELSDFCVRCSSGRVLTHDVDLKGMSPWDYLHLGLPKDTPVNCPFPPQSFFSGMTHDEDRVLFGGPFILDQLVFSQEMKDRESDELQELLEEVEDLQLSILNKQHVSGDKSDLRKYKLRVTRLTKVL